MDFLVVHSNELKGKDKIKLANEQKKWFRVQGTRFKRDYGLQTTDYRPQTTDNGPQTTDLQFT